MTPLEAAYIRALLGGKVSGSHPFNWGLGDVLTQRGTLMDREREPAISVYENNLLNGADPDLTYLGKNGQKL